MTAPKPPEVYTGEKDETTGVAVANDVPYCYSHGEDAPETNTEAFQLVGYTQYSDRPNRTHIYFVPAERLSSLLETWTESDEHLISVAPVTWEDAEAEMAEYRGEK